jgi:hypothetical protein
VHPNRSTRGNAHQTPSTRINPCPASYHPRAPYRRTQPTVSPIRSISPSCLLAVSSPPCLSNTPSSVAFRPFAAPVRSAETPLQGCRRPVRPLSIRSMARLTPFTPVGALSI